jgi:hypothetical protein
VETYRAVQAVSPGRLRTGLEPPEGSAESISYRSAKNPIPTDPPGDPIAGTKADQEEEIAEIS